jgi:hypothetical protein
VKQRRQQNGINVTSVNAISVDRKYDFFSDESFKPMMMQNENLTISLFNRNPGKPEGNPMKNLVLKMTKLCLKGSFK